jgi:phosphate ABC transporter phosphate-binding protein
MARQAQSSVFDMRTAFVCAVAVCIFAAASFCSAQNAESLSQIKKVYVDSLGSGKAAAEMRSRIEDRIRAGHKFEVVGNESEADAILKFSSRIWAAGYVSLGVHPSSANRQPVYDGYLSVELQGKSGATLWSYLVTPSKFSVKRITTDLADQMVQKLTEAAEQESQQAQGKSEGRVSLHGAGGTFPWPIYQKWFESYRQSHSDVRIAYDPLGSEAGIRLLTEGSVDFAGSDMPLSDEAMARSKVGFLQFASVLGAVVPIYNLKNVDHFLNFTPEALAGIYLGKIKRWNDPMIQASNPGVRLPESEIVVVHRSDGSGTTFVWSDYLAKVSTEWRARVGAAATTISWPAGRGAERNEGVAASVRETPNSIGYVELIYAIQHELRYGAVENAAGDFIKADLASVTAAAAGVAEGTSSDFRVSITNPAGKNAYPIATFTWLLLPAANDPARSDPAAGGDRMANGHGTKGDSAAKRAAMVEFLRWALTAGQKQCSGLGYAPLPAAVANQELQVLAGVR